MNRHLVIGAVCFALASLVGLYSDAWAQHDDPGHIEMQQLTPPAIYIDALNDQQDSPEHWIWPHISAVISGANVAAIMVSGKPVACHMHSVDDRELTADLILGYLISVGMLGDDAAPLEIAVVAAFAWAYPCGVTL